MADFSGALIEPYESELSIALHPDVGLQTSRSDISTDKHRTGTHSLRVLPGGYHEAFYGTEAGSKTIAAWVWPMKGVAKMKLMDRARAVLASAVSAGTGDWEQLSISYTMVKGVYILRFENLSGADGDCCHYWDDVV